MENNIIRMPFKKENEQRINTQKRKIPCQLSSKWLQFPQESRVHPQGDCISVDVMTAILTDDQQEKETKICELVLFREDIEAMLIACKPRHFDTIKTK